MTKEQLEKEAIKYDAEHLRMGRTRWYHNVTIKEAYLAGAKPREKRIEKLKKQIEKMKCCGNCGKWENCEKNEMFSQDICGDWELWED